MSLRTVTMFTKPSRLLTNAISADLREVNYSVVAKLTVEGLPELPEFTDERTTAHLLSNRAIRHGVRMEAVQAERLYRFAVTAMTSGRPHLNSIQMVQAITGRSLSSRTVSTTMPFTSPLFIVCGHAYILHGADRRPLTAFLGLGTDMCLWYHEVFGLTTVTGTRLSKFFEAAGIVEIPEPSH